MVWKDDSQSPVPSTGCNAEEDNNSSVRSERPVQCLPGDQRQPTYQGRWRESLQLPHRRRTKWKGKENAKRKLKRHCGILD